MGNSIGRFLQIQSDIYIYIYIFFFFGGGLIIGILRYPKISGWQLKRPCTLSLNIQRVIYPQFAETKQTASININFFEDA